MTRIFPIPRVAMHRVRNLCLAVSIAPIVVVAGCAGYDDDIRSVIVTDGPPPPQVLPELKPGQTMPEAAAVGAIPADEAALDATPSTAVEDADPELLVGMDERAVEATLGAPSLVRDVPPAKIWHYSASDCVVSVYFYLNLERQVFQVLRYEILPRPASIVDGPTCYARLNQPGRSSQNNES